MKIKLLFFSLTILLIAYSGCSSGDEQKSNEVIPVKVIKLQKEKVNKAI